MKHLILMGGRPWVARDKGQHQTEVIFRHCQQSAKVAFCNFAQDESEWEDTVSVNLKMFKSFYNGTLEHRVMNQSSVESDSEWSDIIYIPGGDPFVLINELKPFVLDKLWDGKVIVGASAGADLLCARFPYLQEKRFGDGLGWVKATCIPHWRDDFNNYTEQDWDWAESESLKRNPDLPVLCIPEGQVAEFSVV